MLEIRARQISRLAKGIRAVWVVFCEHFNRGGELLIQFCGIHSRAKCALRQFYLVGVQGESLYKGLFALPFFAGVSILVFREHDRF